MPPSDTQRDNDYLDRLRDYYVEARRIPSFQRICELMGFASKTAAKRLMSRLEVAGFVERTPDDDAWMPKAKFFEHHLADFPVRAGGPDMIEGTPGELFLVDQYLIRHPSRTVMVPVTGDSMVDAGINDGDIVVVERTKTAKSGDIVVAIVDSEFTLKELGVEQGRPILKPHNPAYAIIRPRGELEIFGVVTGLVRRYAS